jgi:MOSC domain-containing protein YiiM
MLSPLEARFALPQQGEVRWIGVRPARREPMQIVEAAEARPGSGLVGDRYRGNSGKREVTLLQGEHLVAIGALVGRVAPVDPALLRRNIIVYGVNLLALQRRPFRIGTALFEGTGLAHPCSRMEEALGEGGYNAMRGHGGITARVLEAGIIRLGDSVSACATEAG